MCLRIIDPEFGGFSAQISIFPHILLYEGEYIKNMLINIKKINTNQWRKTG
jgi:hypothetical protein